MGNWGYNPYLNLAHLKPLGVSSPHRPPSLRKQPARRKVLDPGYPAIQDKGPKKGSLEMELYG